MALSLKIHLILKQSSLLVNNIVNNIPVYARISVFYLTYTSLTHGLGVPPASSSLPSVMFGSAVHFSLFLKVVLGSSQNHFGFGYPTVSGCDFQRTNLSLLNCFGIFVKKKKSMGCTLCGCASGVFILSYWSKCLFLGWKILSWLQL